MAKKIDTHQIEYIEALKNTNVKKIRVADEMRRKYENLKGDRANES